MEICLSSDQNEQISLADAHEPRQVIMPTNSLSESTPMVSFPVISLPCFFSSLSHSHSPARSLSLSLYFSMKKRKREKQREREGRENDAACLGLFRTLCSFVQAKSAIGLRSLLGIYLSKRPPALFFSREKLIYHQRLPHLIFQSNHQRRNPLCGPCRQQQSKAPSPRRKRRRRPPTREAVVPRSTATR